MGMDLTNKRLCELYRRVNNAIVLCDDLRKYRGDTELIESAACEAYDEVLNEKPNGTFEKAEERALELVKAFCSRGQRSKNELLHEIVQPTD